MADMVLYKANICGTDKDQVPPSCEPFTEQWRNIALELLGHTSSGTMQTMFLTNIEQKPALFYERSFDQTTQTSAAPSRCLHAQITALPPDAYQDASLDSILRFRFAGESEICANQLPAAVPSSAILPFPLDKRVIEAILLSCFSRWKFSSPPVSVILEDNISEDALLGTYKTILRAMPYLLRAKSGYCIPPQKAPTQEGVSICFLPMKRAGEAAGDVVYAQNPWKTKRPAVHLSQELQTLCAFLAAASQQERESLFRWLDAFVERGPDGMWRNSRKVPDEYAQIFAVWKRQHALDPREDARRIDLTVAAELERIMGKLHALPLTGERAASPEVIDALFTNEAFLLRYSQESAQLKNRILCDWFSGACNSDRDNNFRRLREIQAYYDKQSNGLQCLLQPIWQTYLLQFIQCDRQTGFTAYEEALKLKQYLSGEVEWCAYETEHRYFTEVQHSPAKWFRHIRAEGGYRPNPEWGYRQALQELEAFLDENDWDVEDAFVIEVFSALRQLRGNSQAEDAPAQPQPQDKQRHKRGRRGDKTGD